MRGPLNKYNPEELANATLADDLRILAAWNSSGILPRQQAVRLMAKILREIAKRKRKGKMRWTLHLDRVKDRELWLLALAELGKEDLLTILSEEVERAKGS